MRPSTTLFPHRFRAHHPADAFPVCAAQGIGAAVGLRFAQAGASVFIIGRNEQLGQDVVKRCRAEAGRNADGRTFEFIKADLSCVLPIQNPLELS